MIVRHGSKVHLGVSEETKISIPGVILQDPKYPHNVGQAIRLCSCYEFKTLIITGNRVDISTAVERLPREERMRDYAEIALIKMQRPFDILPSNAVPICVEFGRKFAALMSFDHPKNAVYVFGPEDGGISKDYRGLCHYHIQIPTKHCLNLSNALATVLYDRYHKAFLSTLRRG